MTPSAQTPPPPEGEEEADGSTARDLEPVMGQRQRRSSKVKQKTEIQRITEHTRPVQRRMRR